MLQNLPTQNWSDSEIGMLVAEAYRLKFTFADAPNHLQSGERWPGISFEEWLPDISPHCMKRKVVFNGKVWACYWVTYDTCILSLYTADCCIMRSCTKYYINKLYVYKVLTTKGAPLYFIDWYYQVLSEIYLNAYRCD